MGFKDVFNKTVAKAAQLKDQVMKSEPVNQAIDKVVEHVTEERSTKEHVKEGAIDVGTAIVLAPFFGLASIPAAAGYAVVEGVLVKKFAKTEAAKKLAESRRNRKPGPGKEGPKPQ